MPQFLSLFDFSFWRICILLLSLHYLVEAILHWSRLLRFSNKIEVSNYGLVVHVFGDVNSFFIVININCDFGTATDFRFTNITNRMLLTQSQMLKLRNHF